MEDPRPLVCPILVGRDDLLALADRRLTEIGPGKGHLLLIAGEAGLGKTRLLGAIERRATTAGFRVVRAGTYPSDLQVPAALLIDLSRALQRDPLLAPLGTRLADRLADDASTDTDPGRRRRLLVLDVADLLAELAGDERILIGLEDLHWSDDLTLEILEATAGRTSRSPRSSASPARRSRRTSSTSSRSSGSAAGPRSPRGPPPGRCYTRALTATTERSSAGRVMKRARDGGSRAGPPA